MAVGYWLEIWRRPGHPQFGRLIDDPPFEHASFHVGVGLLGDGTMTIPDNYDRVDEILRISGASSTSSLVRLREDATGTVVGEWLPSSISPTATKDASTTQVSGNGINEILTYAITEAFDWDGTADWISADPDWIWGAVTNNKVQDGGFELDTLENAGFEEGNTNHWSTPEGGSVQAVEDPIQAQSGDFYAIFNPSGSGSILRRQVPSVKVGETYTITGWLDDLDGVGDRWRFGINGATSASHTNAYEVDGIWYAELANATQGNGSSTGAWQQTTLTFVAGESPVELFIEYLDVNDHNAAVDSFAISGVEFGIGEWVAGNFPATMNIAEISTEQAHSGTRSLKLQGSQPAYYDAFGRISYAAVRAFQPRDIPLEVGKIYTSEAWIYHTAASNRTFQLWASRTAPQGPLAKTVAGGFLPAPGSYHMAADVRSVPPNTWTRLRWTSIADTTSVRVGVAWNGGKVDVGVQQSPTFYIDDVSLYEGLPATTAGDIITMLYNHATEPRLRSPIIWDDGSATDTPYLTLDFDATVDSAGVPWVNDEVAIRIWMRMTLLQAIESFEEQESIEWRIVPDDVENGTWLLQIYNEGGMDAAPATPTVAILGGADDTRRLVRAYRPRTHFLVEGAERVTYRAAATTLQTALGRMETAELNRTAIGADGARAHALTAAATAEISGKVWSYELTNPQDAPLLDFGLGDTIAVHDPPAADGEGRVWEMNVVFSKEATTWDVDILVEEEV